MTARVFVDTNLLVYSYDRTEPEKQQQALQTLDVLAGSRRGAISTQVIAEFFSTVRRKLAPALPLEAALNEASRHLQTWTVFAITTQVVTEALRGVRDHQLNYWDAQVWAAARLNGIPLVLSEDFQDGSVLEGVRFLNPLGAQFRVADWIE